MDQSKKITVAQRTEDSQAACGPVSMPADQPRMDASSMPLTKPRTYLLAIPHTYNGSLECALVRIPASTEREAWDKAAEFLDSRALLAWLIGLSVAEFVQYDDLMEMSVAKIMRETGIRVGYVQLYECPVEVIADPLILPPRSAPTGQRWLWGEGPITVDPDQALRDRHYGVDDAGDGRATD